MVDVDVITCNPYGIEYPYHRFVMEKYHDKFRKIIVSYYQDHRKYDFTDFIVSAMPYALHIDMGEVPGGEDWRNYTVNPALIDSHADWVLFLEQDFVAQDSFWNEVLEQAEDYDVVGFSDIERTTSLQGGIGNWSPEVRLHPAFMMVRRGFIDRTSKDFGAYPAKNRDHFGVFSEELYHLSPRFLDLNQRVDWKHYAGLYSNYMLVQAGKKPNYRPEEFKEFVKMSMELPVVQDSRFMQWSEDCLKVDINS